MQAKSWSRACVRGFVEGLPGLLDEQCFTELISADKRLHRPVAAEEILNFAVLVHTLRRTKHWRGNHLQRIRIRHSIALKAFRFFAVEHRKHHPAWPQQFRDAG